MSVRIAGVADLHVGLTRGQANALIGLSKELIGQAQLKTLFQFAVATDPALAEIAAAVK